MRVEHRLSFVRIDVESVMRGKFMDTFSEVSRDSIALDELNTDRTCGMFLCACGAQDIDITSPIVFEQFGIGRSFVIENGISRIVRRRCFINEPWPQCIHAHIIWNAQ